MSDSSGLELVPAEIDRVLPFRDSAAVVLDAADKKFMIFVGIYEAAALLREIRGERTERPLTHEVISYVLKGFDIRVAKVVVSSIVSNVFCATLVLERDRGDASTAKDEVRLDVRASDAMVIAKKTGSEIWVTRRVLEQVEDVTNTLEQIRQHFGIGDEDSEEEPLFPPGELEDEEDDEEEDEN